MNARASRCERSAGAACCNLAEAELKADLFWRFGPKMQPQIQALMFGYISRQLQSCASHQDCAAFSADTARALCRSHINHLVAQFTAWTPLARR